ncbi:histidine phosphatase family protein [Lichenicoccus sp.]|uniref:histidine phosphatase family protein n=1 Tax=Lichenicoccus sp. TaxID=2781899 RepID=UPI003D0E52D9
MTERSTFLDTPQLEAGVTRLWLIRHALVEQNARLMLYGTMDVALCPDSLVAQVGMYQGLAARLPRTPAWYATPLSRTQRTAQAIQEAGYPQTPLAIEPGLLEQDMGEWQGLAHGDLPERLQSPAHVFWPLASDEVPPGGESMVQVCERVGRAIERIADAHDGQDIVVVSHGGAIRAAVAHALGVDADAALRLSVQNLSLTILERHPKSWRVVAVNEMPGV